MNVRHESATLPHAGALPRDFPQPVSLETLAVVEQVFAQVLQGVRERAERALDGAAEYASWLPPRH
jgi:hypothetical protein